MSVSKITQTVSVRFSPNYIFSFIIPISRSSSHVSHFDLLYSGVEMPVSKILVTPKDAIRFLPKLHMYQYLDQVRTLFNLTYFFYLVYSRSDMYVSTTILMVPRMKSPVTQSAQFGSKQKRPNKFLCLHTNHPSMVRPIPCTMPQVLLPLRKTPLYYQGGGH